MVRSRWRTILLATLYILLVDLVVILLQELILKLDHGWSHLGMFIVDVLLVYILHGYFHWRLFSCVFLGVAAHPSQCIKCCNYHLYSFHRSLFRCDLVEGSQDQELFIAGVVLSWKRGGSSTCLLSSESLQLQSGCALVGVGVAHLSQYVELRAPLWLVTGGAAIAIAHVFTVERAFCFWGESLCCMFYIHSHSDIIPLTIIYVVPFYRKS